MFSVPTFIAFKRGVEIGRLLGAEIPLLNDLVQNAHGGTARKRKLGKTEDFEVKGLRRKNTRVNRRDGLS